MLDWQNEKGGILVVSKAFKPEQIINKLRDVGNALTLTVTLARTSAELHYATDTSGWRHRRL